MPSGQKNVVMGLDAIIYNSFVLDKDNIPHYICRKRVLTSPNPILVINKRKEINRPFPSSKLEESTKYFHITIQYPVSPGVFINLTPINVQSLNSLSYDYINSETRNLNYLLTKINLEGIPDSLRFPNMVSNEILVKVLSPTPEPTGGLPRMAHGWEMYPRDIAAPIVPTPASGPSATTSPASTTTTSLL